MLDLITPTDHAGAYEWLVVLMAHAGVGLIVVAIMAAVFDWLVDGRGSIAPEAWIATVLGYGLIWEGTVQRYGAGLADAGVDTFAVAMGASIGIAAWQRRAGLLALSFVALSIVAARGVKGRK